MRARVPLIAALLTLAAAGARAQDPAPPPDPPSLLVGVEARRDRIRYHFDNPSSIDTSALVPHFFEQTYEADNLWLVATGRYSVGGVGMETSVGATPQRDVRADDYDTFFDPGNVVFVAGTTGDAAMQALVVSQRVDIGHPGPVVVSLGFRLRWDRFDFHLGHKTITRNGTVILATDVTSPEMTDSSQREIFAAFRTEPALGGSWRLRLSGEISPLTLARLSVQLPEKYPGQDLVFLARVAAVSGRVTLVRAGARWPIEIGVEADGTVSYRSSDQLSRSAQSVALSVGHRW